jgi:hypothetical protein
MKLKGVILSRSTAKAKNLALLATNHEILRPEFILSGVEGASE